MSLTNSIEFLTYNICYSRRATGEFDEYSWENRRNDVYKLVISANPTIIFLQEILTQNTGEVQSKLTHYRWHFETTNSRNGICSNGIGIKNDFLPGVEQHKFSYNFNSYDKTAEKVLGLVLGDLCLINAHFSFETEGRLSMAEHFDQAIPQTRIKHLIIAGDFNSFPDCKGAEQVALIATVTKTSCISDQALSETTKQIATHSFQAYPYDKVPEEASKLPGKLDHILIRGFKIAQEAFPTVMDVAKVEGKNFAPSDHYPIKATLLFD